MTRIHFRSFWFPTRLPTCVASVHNNICSCGVCTSVTGKVQIHTFQLSGISITLQRGEVEPLLFHLKWTVPTHLGVDVSRADAVDTSKIGPFDGQRLGQVDDASL